MEKASSGESKTDGSPVVSCSDLVFFGWGERGKKRRRRSCNYYFIFCNLYIFPDELFSSLFSLCHFYFAQYSLTSSGALSIPPGTDSIVKGMKEAKRRGIKDLFLEKGIHVNSDRIELKEEWKISGAGRDQTFVKGCGFDIEGEKEEGKNVVLKDMTMSGIEVSGRDGLSWLCDSMTITQCGSHGVCAWENTKGRLINCVITKCRGHGIFCGENALIELEGDQTKVDGNNTTGYGYGLSASDTSSIIHLLFPLTKESVSTNNHRGRNYNDDGTIETVNSF